MQKNNYLNKIINGDTLQTLKKIPSNFVDVGVTSPPYNKQEKNRGWLVKEVRYKKHKDSLTESEYQKNQIDVLNELYRVIKPGGSFFYNHKIRWDRGELIHPLDWLRKSDWTLRQEIIWNRKIAGNIRGWRFWQVEERIYWLYKPIGNNKIGEELPSKYALLTSIWDISPENKNSHPAPFPIEIPTRVICAILNDRKGVVIDPYMGSGTTAVAAQHLGKNYIGIENCEEYVEYANNRLKNSDAELDKINREIKLHRVKKSFKQRKLSGEYSKHKQNSKLASNKL